MATEIKAAAEARIAAQEALGLVDQGMLGQPVPRQEAAAMLDQQPPPAFATGPMAIVAAAIVGVAAPIVLVAELSQPRGPIESFLGGITSSLSRGIESITSALTEEEAANEAAEEEAEVEEMAASATA